MKKAPDILRLRRSCEHTIGSQVDAPRRPTACGAVVAARHAPGHRRRAAHQMVRRTTGGRRRLVRGRRGRGHGAARPERLGQDHDPADPDRLPAAERGHRAHRRASTSCATVARGARAGSATCPRTRRSTAGCGSASSSRSWAGCAASRGDRLRAAWSAVVRERLALGGMSGIIIGKLSRGYRQRVAIAQALLRRARRSWCSTSRPTGSIRGRSSRCAG